MAKNVVASRFYDNSHQPVTFFLFSPPNSRLDNDATSCQAKGIAPMSDPTARTVAVLIALPSEVATVGLTAALSSRAELHVLGTAHSPEQVRAALSKGAPEIALVAPEWLSMVRKLMLETEAFARLIAFGSRPHLGATAESTACYGCGYVSYLTPSKVFLPLVDVVSDCRLPTMDPDHALCQRCPVRDSLVPPKPNLTAREMEVFVAIGQGFGASDIAAQLGISVKTVESHRENIKSKLGLHSAWEMNAIAADWCRGGAS